MSVLLFILLSIISCNSGQAIPLAEKPAYSWTKLTPAAAFPQGYNYPVFVTGKKMYAFNNGTWMSSDGRNWIKTRLPESGLNSAYQKFVQLDDAVYSLGSMTGNYTNFKVSTKIMRTRDFKSWEAIAEKSNLPRRVFYGAVVFQNKIWLMGGYDGRRYYNDVWNSADGINWTRIMEQARWSPRSIHSVLVFKDKIWFRGGGVIDGEREINPNSHNETWTSADGKNWSLVTANSRQKAAGTPVVFDDKLWLIGGNRNNGNFGKAVFVSQNGTDWSEMPAPWSPRGGVAVWVFNGKLFMTGGKYSHNENGEIKFVYSNDVWAMSKN